MDERGDQRFGHTRADDSDPHTLAERGEDVDDDEAVAGGDTSSNESGRESGGERAGMERGEKPRKSAQREKPNPKPNTKHEN
jgi:hypothetical protein